MNVRLTVALVFAACGTLGGCGGVQSALAPHGEHASLVAGLSWTMFIGAALIALAVAGLTLYAMFGPPERRARFLDRKLIIGGGIVFPTATLSALLVYSLLLTQRIVPDPAGENTLRIEVVGEQWWWRVHYLGAEGERAFATANEIRIPTGRLVEFILTTADVIHSFWVPGLAGKLDMIPGHVNTLRLKADKTGVLRGQCAEYCGGAHALMALMTVVDTPEEYADWFDRQREPAGEPNEAPLVRGRDLFLASGCGGCHTIRGIGADGVIGPDLTHVGSRRTIGAGLLPVTANAMADWIASPDHFKPEVRMPPFGGLEADDLDALAAYLESLK
ncbi:MAG: cytochrome c oxidase subunit II [Rhodospirillales bacterium]|nr:cytochrome c oxidase subunit II [Rhodospirillales bacterium]